MFPCLSLTCCSILTFLAFSLAKFSKYSFLNLVFPSLTVLKFKLIFFIFQATPKLNNQKRQNVYIKKLRPQSVLDGAVSSQEDFSVNSFCNASTSSQITSDIATKVQHLTKMRPRNRKSRAPTRVAVVDSNVNSVHVTQRNEFCSPQLDEGLDGFFPVVPVSLAQSLSAASLDVSPISSLNDQFPSRSQQPKKILKKIGFKSTVEQTLSSIDNVNQIELNNDSFVRGSSPIFYGTKRTEHVSICAEPLESTVRGHSPVPDLQQHTELFAEMKAKQEKRSYVPSLNDPEDDSKSAVPDCHAESLKTVDKTSPGVSVAKRATIFGELCKSPSKVSINLIGSQPEDSGATKPSSIVNRNTNSASHSFVPPIKQRPKSVVGLLGAKFELSMMNSNGNK